MLQTLHNTGPTPRHPITHDHPRVRPLAQGTHSMQLDVRGPTQSETIAIMDHSTGNSKGAKPSVARHLPLAIILIVAVVGFITLRDYLTFDTPRDCRAAYRR